MWDIYRYRSLSVIKVGADCNQTWYQYHKYRYVSRKCNGWIFANAYHRLFDQKGNKFLYEADGTLTAKLDDASLYNILLLLAIIMTYAVDTSICERGFALMNNLKTARRSRMGNLLLRTLLMTICELGKEWEDPSLIPVDEIVQEWRSQSTRGRYESAMWRAAGLEEPNAKRQPGGQREAAGEAAAWAAAEAGAQVDNMEAGGFFARFGRERDGPRATVVPPAAQAAAPLDDSDDSDS